MGFIAKLKELFGIDTGRQTRAGAGTGVDVTVEREAGQRAGDPATETESAVKEPAAGNGQSTADSVDEGVDGDEATDAAEQADDDTTTPEADTPAETESPDGDAEADAEPTAVDDAAAGESTDVVKGIGPAYAETLADAGVDTVGDLAEATVDDLASATDISESRLERWVARAKSRL